MNNRKIIIFIILAITILIFIGVAGLLGWNTLIVPALGKIESFSFPLLIGFSFLAGAISFFAPCSFALFPGYVAFYIGSKEDKKVKPWELGLFASAGIISFFMVLSIILILPGKYLKEYLKFLAPIVGLIVFISGILLFVGYSFKLQFMQKLFNKFKTKKPRSRRNIYLFGLGYGAASVGCTIPLLFTLIIIPISAGKIIEVFLSLLAYALSMSFILVLLTSISSLAKKNIYNQLIRKTGIIKAASGIVLIFVGAFMIYYNLLFTML